MKIGTVVVEMKIKVNMKIWDAIKLRISGMANLFEKIEKTKENTVDISTEIKDENKLTDMVNKGIKNRKIEI